VKEGDTVQLKAVATFADKTTQNITSAATWGSSDTAIATLDSVTKPGLATSKAKGTVEISATHTGISGKTKLTIN